ncbi:N-acetyltransferase [Leucobacter sp. BZR 635]
MAMVHGSQGSADRVIARRFARADWEWVQRWFEDETLDRELGPLDSDWLDHVLSDSEGVQLVIEAAHPSTGRPAPIALVGVVWGGDGTGHAITDLAIDPARRGYGLGRAAIDATIAWPEHPQTDCWIAFVDQENTGARSFFAAIGWTDEGLDGEAEEAMYRFTTQRRG